MQNHFDKITGVMNASECKNDFGMAYFGSTKCDSDFVKIIGDSFFNPTINPFARMYSKKKGAVPKTTPNHLNLKINIKK